MPMRKSILPRSVQIIVEDKAVLRIYDDNAQNVIDYEINERQLIDLARQALLAYRQVQR